MTIISAVVLDADPGLPMFDVVSWGVLVLSLLITFAWLAYLYR